MNPSELAKKIREALLYYGFKPREPRELYVTEVIGCLRKAYFNVKFNANPVVESSDAVFGKLVHLALPVILKDILKAEFEVPMEHDLGNGWILRGRADAVTEDAVYEFKFSSPYSDVKPLYYLQVNTYAHLLDKNEFYLIIIDKRTLNVDVTKGQTDDKAFDTVVERAKTVLDSLKADKPPFGPNFQWECNGCPYNIICLRWKEWINQTPLKP